MPAPLVIGRYAVFRKIASGGMAAVHLGRLLGPVGFSRTVAIKRMHAHLVDDTEFVSMFLDEARLAARIRHPNVVPTLDVLAEGNELFLVLEYVHGETLSRLHRLMTSQGLRIPVPIALSIMSGVLHGLHAAHEARDERGQPLEIVHRDMSPQNVLVGVDGTARVLDFGVAKAVGRMQTTRDGQLKGKLAYMAPEQLRGGRVTRRCDVYATSVVLWEVLTGQRLFQDESEARVFQRVLDGEVTRPSQLVEGLPPALEAVVMRGLARDPEERFATAREMAGALETAGRVALPRVVGTWVEQIAAESLASRAEVIAEAENEGAAMPVPGASPVTPGAPVTPFGPMPVAASAASSSIPVIEGTIVGPGGATSGATSANVPVTAPPVGAGVSRWLVGLVTGLLGGVFLVLVALSLRSKPAPSRAAPPPPPSAHTDTSPLRDEVGARAAPSPPSAPIHVEIVEIPAPATAPTSAQSATTAPGRPTSKAPVRAAPRPTSPGRPSPPATPAGDIRFKDPG